MEPQEIVLGKTTGEGRFRRITSNKFTLYTAEAKHSTPSAVGFKLYKDAL